MTTIRYKIFQLDPLVINEFREGVQIRSFFAEGSQFSEEYAAWLAEGNEPAPPDPRPDPVYTPTLQDEIDALKVVVGMLMEGDDDV